MTSRHPAPEAVRGARIKRTVIDGVLVLLLAVAQCSFFARLHVCPATPDLLLGLVLCVLLLDSVYAAAGVALAAGFLVDALGTTSFFLSPPFYFALVLILCLPVSKMLPTFPSYLLLLIPALIGRAAYTLLCFALLSGPMPALSYVGGVLLRECLTTALLVLPIYPIVKLCMRPLRARTRFHF